MTFARLCSAAAAAVLLGAAPLPEVYSDPAGVRAAGAPRSAVPYDTVLPNGRIIAPIGRSIVVGMNALGVALTPDGKYAIVSNDDDSGSDASSRYEPQVRGGYSLAVVDTSTMRVTGVYTGARFFLGIAAVRDPANPSQTLVLAAGGSGEDVRFFHIDSSGALQEAGLHVAIPLASDPRYANAGHAFPGWITISPDGRTAYVVNDLAGTVSSIDIAQRQVTGTVQTGFFPYAAAVGARRLFVTDPGLMQYAKLPQAVRVPQFTNVAFAPAQASALTGFDMSPDGTLSTSGQTSTPMDQPPDGVQNVGGAQPTAIAISKDRRYAYVCMTNVDRVAIVDLAGTPRVVGGLQLRLFDRSPYGTQPDAIAIAPDGKRLYVALAGLNAVAVLDARNPLQLHRLGLIPTGWYPSAIAVSKTGRFLYVTNSKGFGEEPGFQGGTADDGVWATLQRIDLHKLPLGKTTLSALKYNRVAVRAVENAMVPPLRSGRRSSIIDRVVFIMEEHKSYDAVLGDLTDDSGRPLGNGDPSLVSYGANATPNLHALAREFALASNFYADAADSGSGHQFATAGMATAYQQKILPVSAGRAPLDSGGEDPEDYPREGYIFNAVYRAGLQYRDYGGLLRLAGYDGGESADPKVDDPYYRNASDETAFTSGLGGLYSLDVPALASLNSHVDLNYPGWNLRIRDVRRAQEFIRDYTHLERAGSVPAFTYIWLPDDADAAGVADGDRALGMIVDFLSHRPDWHSTAIFITAGDTAGSRDHVDAQRTYAILVSPFAKHRFVSDLHLSTVSILKTEDELLGLAPLSLGDLLAGDMASFFTDVPDDTPFTAVQTPAQTGQSGNVPNVERPAAAALTGRRNVY